MVSHVPSRSRTTCASSATSATPATASGTSPIPPRLSAQARCASRSSQRSEPTTISRSIIGAPSGLTRTRALTSTSLAPRPQPEPLFAGSATVRPSGRHKAQELLPPSCSRPLNAPGYVAFWTTNLRTVAATITRRHIANLLARLATVQAQLNHTARIRDGGRADCLKADYWTVGLRVACGDTRRARNTASASRTPPSPICHQIGPSTHFIPWNSP